MICVSMVISGHLLLKALPAAIKTQLLARLVNFSREIDSNNNVTRLFATCKDVPLEFSIAQWILNDNRIYFKTNQKSLILIEGFNGEVLAGVSSLFPELSIFLDESS